MYRETFAFIVFIVYIKSVIKIKENDMTKEEMIECLLAAEKAFRKLPDPDLFNDAGLCKFFKHVFRLNDEQLMEILHDHYSGAMYTFGQTLPGELGNSQREMHNNADLKKYRYDRADWCFKEIFSLR